MKVEREDVGLHGRYPRRYLVLERTLKKARGNQKEFLKKTEQQLNAGLLKNGIPARAETREKHLYSIYNKMRLKLAILNEIVDASETREIVDTPDTCYRPLVLVHTVFNPIPGRF